MPRIFYKGGSDMLVLQNEKTGRVLVFQRADDGDHPYATVSPEEALALVADHPDLLVAEEGALPVIAATQPNRQPRARKKAE